jgi:hypothetical protein
MLRALVARPTTSYLNHIEVGLKSVWTAQNKSPILNVWSQQEGTTTGVLNCRNIINAE